VGSKGGLASNDPSSGENSSKVPTLPKGLSESGKAEQKVNLA
jgi:hypothetical protein